MPKKHTCLLPFWLDTLYLGYGKYKYELENIKKAILADGLEEQMKNFKFILSLIDKDVNGVKDFLSLFRFILKYGTVAILIVGFIAAVHYFKVCIGICP